MIYGEGFTQRSETARVETQYLYYAKMKIIIDSVQLKERLEEGVKWKEKRRRERKNRKEAMRNRKGV